MASNEAPPTPTHGEAWLRHALAQNPEDVDAALDLARVLVHEGKTREAGQWVAKVLAARPNDPDALLVEGMAALDWGEAGRAVAALTQACRHSDPPGPQLLLTLATALIRARRYEEAIDIAEQAATASLTLREPYLVGTQAALQAGQAERAQTIAQAGLARSPQDDRLQEALATTLLVQERYEEAETILDRMLLRERDNIQAHTLKEAIGMLRHPLWGATVRFLSPSLGFGNDRSRNLRMLVLFMVIGVALGALVGPSIMTSYMALVLLSRWAIQQWLVNRVHRALMRGWGKDWVP